MTVTTELFSPLELRCGLVLENRIAKAAMEENMAGREQLPDERLSSLYRRWGAGGAGLLITGNVMVHAEALTGPGGVVLDDSAPLRPFSQWAMGPRPFLPTTYGTITPSHSFWLPPPPVHRHSRSARLFRSGSIEAGAWHFPSWPVAQGWGASWYHHLRST